MKYFLIFILVLCYYCYNNIFFNTTLIGTYQNVSFKGSPVLPNSIDTLTLFENNEFYSKSLGYGTFELSYRLGGTNIIFINKNWQERKISRTYFGTPTIIMFSDLNHHYEKLTPETFFTQRQLNELKVKENLKTRKEAEYIKRVTDEIYKERKKQEEGVPPQKPTD